MYRRSWRKSGYWKSLSANKCKTSLEKLNFKHFGNFENFENFFSRPNFRKRRKFCRITTRWVFYLMKNWQAFLTYSFVVVLDYWSVEYNWRLFARKKFSDRYEVVYATMSAVTTYYAVTTGVVVKSRVKRHSIRKFVVTNCEVCLEEF